MKRHLCLNPIDAGVRKGMEGCSPAMTAGHERVEDDMGGLPDGVECAPAKGRRGTVSGRSVSRLRVALRVTRYHLNGGAKRPFIRSLRVKPHMASGRMMALFGFD